MSALPIDSVLESSLEARPARPLELVIDLRNSAEPGTVPAETLYSTAVVSDPVLSASIADLVADEADLSYQAYLGDLHPANAMRLAAISAELDRRWSTFA